MTPAPAPHSLGQHGSGILTCALESFGLVKKEEKLPCSLGKETQEEKWCGLDGVCEDQEGKNEVSTLTFTPKVKAPK